MKLRILSDLHLEWHADGGMQFVRELANSDDVLVLAGDITIGKLIPLTARAFLDRFQKVIYIHGNHEYYGSDEKEVDSWSRKVAAAVPDRWHCLDNDILQIGETRILGTSLWFPETDFVRYHRSTWSDYLSIEGFGTWVHERNHRAIEFLKRELKQGDVVVTHYLPSWRSVHPKWANSHVNCFFISDLEELILERQPKLWIHGHTHDSMDYMIGETRVVCNPFGYFMHDENPKFDPNFCVEVP